eukprot:CAMPEP_0118933152 /NCGR_PEP_ID=MMETSP1169-20130426/11445_1 /TAXON_ID=36882 /ORGANISM="Pyramimonas obovata, Strain CCMP722" /LENGTH=137 /DNA_ID=CAMNT_0006875885 /DNA_START=46 /DNA_END=457 /DNA_ORIENTATION=-
MSCHAYYLHVWMMLSLDFYLRLLYLTTAAARTPRPNVACLYTNAPNTQPSYNNVLKHGVAVSANAVPSPRALHSLRAQQAPRRRLDAQAEKRHPSLLTPLPRVLVIERLVRPEGAVRTGAAVAGGGAVAAAAAAPVP